MLVLSSKLIHGPKPIHAALALALGAAFAVPAPPARAASTRNYLTVEGRVTNHSGRPVRDAWVFCLGSRRASARVDTSGSYRLEIPGATLEELQRTALKIRIQARRTGWRFALPNGSPELGLDMRVVAEESKLSRLRVRSNDSAAVEAVANSVVLDASPRALLNASFVGSEGPTLDIPAVPLDVIQEITLAGSATSIPEITAADEMSLPVTPGGSSYSPTTSASGAAPEGQAVLQEPPPGKDATKAPGPQSTAPPTGSSGKPTNVRPAQGQDGKTSSKPKNVRPALESEPTGQTSSATKSPSPSQATKASGSTTHSGTAASAGALGSAAPRDTAAAVAPSGTKPYAGGTSGTSKATSGKPKDPTLDSDRSLQRVYSRYDPMVSVGTKQQGGAHPVPDAGGAIESGTPGTPGEPCDCVIRGTVEVQSDAPLRGKTEVVIAVEDSPEASSHVELFMGPPRAFEIRRGPCGVHRLRLYTRSKQRFVLTSVEPRVVCREGSKQQIRLIMEPVARWGIR